MWFVQGRIINKNSILLFLYLVSRDVPLLLIFILTKKSTDKLYLSARYFSPVYLAFDCKHAAKGIDYICCRYLYRVLTQI